MLYDFCILLLITNYYVEKHEIKVICSVLKDCHESIKMVYIDTFIKI